MAEAGAGAAFKEGDTFHRWKQGLPSNDELTPLNQTLITPILACAFSISETGLNRDRSEESAERAAQAAYRCLREGTRGGAGHERPPRRDYSAGYADHPYAQASQYTPPVSQQQFPVPPPAASYPPQREPYTAVGAPAPPAAAVAAPSAGVQFPGMLGNMPYPPFGARSDGNSDGGGSRGSKKARTASEMDGGEESDSQGPRDGGSAEEPQTRALKRPRLVWTPQLHKRFVDAVSHLGVEHAVPKTIMQLMNVEGLTRENVASHLQKYRLYLKRMQGGGTNDGPLSHSDQLFASGPLPHSLGMPGGPVPTPQQQQFAPRETSNGSYPGGTSIPPYLGSVGPPASGPLLPHISLDGTRPPYPPIPPQGMYNPYMDPRAFAAAYGALAAAGSGQPARSPPRDSYPREGGESPPPRGLPLFPTSSH